VLKEEDLDRPLPRLSSYCWKRKIKDRPAKSSKGEGRSLSRNMLTPSFVDIAEHPSGIKSSNPRVSKRVSRGSRTPLPLPIVSRSRNRTHCPTLSLSARNRHRQSVTHGAIGASLPLSLDEFASRTKCVVLWIKGLDFFRCCR
jgi:hypothetical protein